MTGLSELRALFPGAQKVAVLIEFKSEFINIVYEDGSSVTLKDPIQVQDLELPAGTGDIFMKALRKIEPTAARETFMERTFLEDLKKKINP